MNERTSDVGEVGSVFLDAVAQRRLVLPFWAGSGEPAALAVRLPSPAGEREVVWREASGRAVLHAYCVYHRQYHPDFPPPYAVCLIELEEGQQLVSTVIAPPAALRVGMALRAAFEPQGRLVFHPAPGEGRPHPRAPR